MSLVSPVDRDAVLVRAADAEVVEQSAVNLTLLADSSTTGGALSTMRVTLARGADGALPHHHTSASELFYVLDGEVQILAGERVVTAGEGDLVVVPPNMPHAFGAAPGAGADLLIVITPGIERFDYFRLLARLSRGEATLDELLASQERFDNHFLDSPVWREARAGEAD
ncbi:quercetin dioxygenase-like cupin family protein [Streptosporangium becharense]|uniref:Quercetin dioxygenase-like cupin family protein n=1 Tax=Streptosporangium becharense TaxID=1816182 RepID=A0A7W9MJW4_9ACTN|nr:cupin domain-containing protein [Streptosporangium becharense]MBB2914261.1 quercetin dioxygenase-like cupin family protein [Streptosporangium becharense]MBB5823707.1 quercetin dioxygenase-like cupin family protein [Streptosporangium becharense]